MKDKIKIYQKWWFWVIIALIITIIVISFFTVFYNQGIGTAGISLEEFDEINLGMTQFKVEQIIDPLNEWNNDNVYHKACEKISTSSKDGKYTNIYKYYGEKKGYALITFEVDYSEGYYGLKYPEVIKKEKFDLK